MSERVWALGSLLPSFTSHPPSFVTPTYLNLCPSCSVSDSVSTATRDDSSQSRNGHALPYLAGQPVSQSAFLTALADATPTWLSLPVP
ncbi:hypothetical protein E2C01_076940 [Portunus trituberculatus]|uniref:Uncharacterized protein n=1 Tax=Portunus trituberculatus TaxID=210409 RepID=A0A5B7IJ22_PORTR|nr:hypothetical protein [Portunus trituberculatus]